MEDTVKSQLADQLKNVSGDLTDEKIAELKFVSISKFTFYCIYDKLTIS